MKIPFLTHMRCSLLVKPAIAAAFALGITSCRPVHADFLLKTNDRVVFFGDSITEERNYTRPFQDYVYARYPDRHIRFYNAGWSGDQLSGALNRLERDVLSRNPTVVTLSFGMNDGHYQRMTPEVAALYREKLEAIVKILTDKGIRVVIFSPPPVDEAMRPPWLSYDLKDVSYNTTLNGFGTICREVAAKYNATYFDIIAPILSTLAALKAQNPNPGLLRDGVHPDEKGGVVMAGAMLMSLGAEPMPPLADVTAAQLSGPDKSQVPLAGPVSVPLWLSEEDADFARTSGFLNLAAQQLRVRGLATGQYEVRVGDSSAGRWSATELNKGVLIPGGYSARARRIFDATNWKETNYFNAWRVLNLDSSVEPVRTEAIRGLLQADDGLQTTIESLNTPVTGLTITLKPTGLPENAGPNLAIHKPYTTSDPNTHNYGMGGLTDGIWSPDNNHTFATNEADTFPKMATIDLGQVAPVNRVFLGVPAFGSTRTVRVAVSSDGQNFADKGTYVFTAQREERHLFTFPDTPARYVRLTYLDHYPQEYGYAATFAFTSEVEVYGPATQ